MHTSLEFEKKTWQRIPGTVQDSVEFFRKLEAGESAWGKAKGTVDTSSNQVFAWLWHFMSYERLEEHRAKNGDLLRREILVPGSHSKIMIGMQKFPGGLANRIFSIWWTWIRYEDGTIVLAFADMNEYDAESPAVKAAADLISADAAASKAVRGSTRGFWRIKPLAPNISSVTLVQQGSVGGSIPSWVLDKSVKSTLNVLKRLEDKYQRNGAKVDAEMRAAFPLPLPALSELSREQKRVVNACLELEVEYAGSTAWSNIKALTPFVKMWMKHTPPKKGERSVAVGKATVVVDSPANIAAAWWFAYCSRDRMRISVEEDNPARLVVSEASPHDIVVATVKSLPFPLKKREFVFRQICYAEPDEEIVVVTESVDDDIDYGEIWKTVRGITRNFVRFLPLGNFQCRVEYFQYADAGGEIPVWIVNSKLPEALIVVDELRAEFQRDDEIDAEEREKLAEIVRAVPQVYSQEEESIIERVETKFSTLDEGAFINLESLDHLVTMGCIFVAGDTRGIARASTVLDASMEEASAWEMAKMSRENMKEHAAYGGLERSLQAQNQHKNIYQVVYDLGIPGFLPREAVQAVIWKRKGSDKLEVIADSVEHVDFPTRSEYVRATSTVLYEYEKLNDVGNTPQTRITYTMQADLGGSIPNFAVNKQLVGFLMYLSTMRKRFDRSAVIDRESRKAIVDAIRRHSDAYSEEENEIINAGLDYFTLFEGEKAKTLKMVSPLTSAKIAFKTGDSHAWGWSSTVVRASPEEILAHMWDTLARSKRRKDDLEKTIEETLNGHNQLVYNKKRTPKIICDREFLGRMVWKKVGDGSYVVVSKEEESEKRPRLENVDGTVREKYPSAMKIEGPNEKETKVTYIIHPDAGGALPSWLMNHYIGSNLRKVTEVQEYFQELRTLNEYDEKDGRALGMRLMHPGGSKRRKAREKVSEIVERHAGLKELTKEFPWLAGMLEEIVEMKLHRNISVGTKLDCLSEREARRIGKSLIPALRARKTAEAGVYQWKKQNRSMEELFERYGWMEALVITMGQEVVKTAAWGLAWRVGTGAGLSMLDLASDLSVVVGYLNTKGQEGFGVSLLVMIGACLAIQLLMVWGQNRKKPTVMA